MEKEQAQRLDALYESLLHGAHTIDEQVARAMVDAADFHALLRACLADVEREKLSAHAALARAIAGGAVPPGMRRHFVLALRNSSFQK